AVGVLSRRCGPCGAAGKRGRGMTHDVLVEHSDPWMREHGIKRSVILSVSLAGFPPLPNRRMHWREKADENRQWRGDTYTVAREAWRQHDHASDFPLRRAVVQVVVIRPDKRG